MRRIFADRPLTESERNKRFYERHKDEENARNRMYYPKWYAENKEAIKARRRDARHKVTQEWVDKKTQEQGGRCAICQKLFEKTPHIDHRHECCGEIKSCDQCRRGLLCQDCNLGLGRFKDDPVVLQNAIEYLKKHGKDNQCSTRM